jgi:hypothetical protein
MIRRSAHCVFWILVLTTPVTSLLISIYPLHPAPLLTKTVINLLPESVTKTISCLAGKVI